MTSSKPKWDVNHSLIKKNGPYQILEFFGIHWLIGFWLNFVFAQEFWSCSHVKIAINRTNRPENQVGNKECSPNVQSVDIIT